MADNLLDSDFVEHIPCTACGSSDANSLYSDGHAHCFSCGKTTQGEQTAYVVSTKKTTGLLGDTLAFAAPVRGLTLQTLNKFRYQVGTLGGERVHVAPYIVDGQVIAQKLRFKNKDFRFLGDTKHVPLFGQHLWKSGGKRIVVTEGEIDAMSVSQAQQNKWPVVSVPNGAQGARKALANNLEYLETFEEIILCFDSDKPGIEAANECIKLFTPGKCKLVTLALKDANEMLLAGRNAELISAIWDAVAPTYEGVFTGTEVAAMPVVPVTTGDAYPWQTMTEWMYGMRPNEMICYGAGSGIGKTDTIRAIIAGLLKQGKTVGTILLEEPDLQLTLTSIAGKIDGQLYHIPGIPVDVVRMEATKQAVAKQLIMYKTQGSLDIPECMNLIRYMVVAHGCTHIFLDHVTALLDSYSGDQLSGMKEMMAGLNSLNKELSFTLHYVSHLRKTGTGNHTAEEGGRVTLDAFVGGKAVVQYANAVFGIERDQQADEENERDTSVIRCLKDRFTGQATGRTMRLLYNRSTGIKTEIEDEAIASWEAATSGEF
jgi:twinkle protein